jgi:formylglycine-generating enzyme required for sulfatase activity
MLTGVYSHLINEGVQETPPTNTSTDGAVGGPDAKELYVNLDEANVGFVNWTPTPITAQGDKLAGRCGMGGLWEWTSSPLEKREGFEPMKLYPNYSG